MLQATDYEQKIMIGLILRWIGDKIYVHFK